MEGDLVNCAWFIYEGERIFVQKLVGEWHYWDKDGWHPLTERVKISMKLDENQK